MPFDSDPTKTTEYSVTSIGDDAFSYCTSLTSITIPNSVTSMGDYAFDECTSLTSITIPNGVTSIGYEAFYYCSDLTSITIPNSVTSMGDYAFSYCTSLTSIAIPNGVTSIGYEAFSYCTSLGSITIPNSVTSMGDYAFDECTSLTSITIPNSVTSMGDYAFFDCSSLTSITIPNSVTSLGIAVFGSCSKLVSLTIGNGVTSIGDGAFEFCTKLTSVSISNGVTNIGSQAFEDDTSLGSITIPNSVTSMGDYAFDECTSLTSITIPNSVTSIGNFEFAGCSSLTSITIPNDVTSIGQAAFGWCTNLTSITIPNSVTSIGTNAFYYCPRLTSITIPNSVTTIGEAAFSYCSSLTSVMISNGVATIGDYAFAACASLTSITIPNSVTSIGEQAFYACSSLRNVCFEGNEPSDGGNIFESDPVSTIYYISGTPGWGATFSGIPTSPCTQCGPTPQVTITVSASPASGGTVSGGGTFAAGSSQTVTATASSGYTFANWTQNGTVVSTSAGYTFTLTGNETLVANFTANLATITVNANPTAGGTVTGGGTFAVGLQVQISAAAAMFYAFAAWSDGNTDNPRTITVPAGGASYTALFNKTATITFYHQPGDNANGYGHAFLSITSVNGDTDFYGFYFHNNWDILTCNKQGYISKYEPTWDFNISYPITIHQYDSAGGLIMYDRDNLPVYCLFTFNCMDWVASIANAAGINLTSYKDSAGISDPRNFGQYLSSLGAGTITYDGGLISQNNSAHNVAPMRPLGPIPLDETNQIPYDYSYSGLENAGHTAPASLATSIGIGYDLVNLGANNANIISGLSLNIVGTNASQDLISMNWGDGSAFQEQSLTFSHVYSNGTYQADLLIIDAGAVHSYQMTIIVSSAAAAYITINVTAFPPMSIPNQGLIPSDPVPDFVPSVQYTVAPTNGYAPLTVQFNSTNLDSGGLAITQWNWNFGDGATSTNQNPIHIYRNLGTFNPSLVATDNIGLTVSGSGPSIRATFNSGLILNGDFETGNFTNWTSSGNFSYCGVSTSSNYVYSGQYGAKLGPSGSLGYLSQTLATTPGTSYLLSFWLDSPDGKIPNEFLVSWNGNTLLDQTNLPAIGWTNIQFVVTATTASTVLQFGFQDDPSYLGLDDISVVAAQAVALPGITGVSLSGTNLVINGSNGLSGKTCYVLMSTNVTLPLNQWAPVATNVLNASGSFTITATNAVNLNVPQCFYILQMQ